MHYASYYNNLEALTLLYESHFVDVNDTDNSGCTALHAGVKCNETVELLLTFNFNPTSKDDQDRYPLHYALIGGHADTFLTLINHVIQNNLSNFSVNDLDKKGHSLLHYCSKTNLKECLHVLLELGIDVTRKDTFSHNFLHFAANFGSFSLMDELFQNTRKHRLSSLVTSANVYGQKPLHFAGARGNGETCEYLIDKKAPSWAPDKFGCTALHYASFFANFDAIHVLLKQRDLQRTDKFGAKPIHFAALGGKLNLIKELISNGGNIHDPDHQGRTAIFYAGNESTLQFLHSQGLDIFSMDKKKRSILFTSIQLGTFLLPPCSFLFPFLPYFPFPSLSLFPASFSLLPPFLSPLLPFASLRFPPFPFSSLSFLTS